MSSRLLTGAAIEGRLAVRGLVHSPGFSIGVVLVLGVAIAGMVTMTTAAYELFLKKIGIPFSKLQWVPGAIVGHRPGEYHPWCG